MDVPHTVYRVPAPIVVPVVESTIVRTNPVTTVAVRPSFTPTPARPAQAVPVTVTQKPTRRGVITRG